MPQFVLATDPPVSEVQRRAMQAAAHGHSTLGIPQSVGKEFVGDDNASTKAAGVIFVTPEGEALFLKRSDAGDHAGTWCFPGGGIESDESADTAARREAYEETGRDLFGDDQRLAPVDRRTSDEGVDFATFVHPVDDRFIPQINDESATYVWAPLDNPPEPLHPGVRSTLGAIGQDAEFNESDHPRNHGQFSTSSGSSGSGGEAAAAATPAPQKRSVAEKIKAHASTIKQHGKAAHEYVKGAIESGKANEIINAAVSKIAHKVKDPENVKAALGGAVVFVMYHGLQIDFPADVEHAIRTEVEHLSQNAKVAVGEAREMMRSVMTGLIGMRQKQADKRMAGDDGEGEQDGVVDALKAMLDILDESEEGQAAHAQDSILFAFDRQSVRTIDPVNGHMHVARTNISKATVNPYRGGEIPEWQELGLDPEKIYNLLRPSDELAKAASSFNNLPLLEVHKPVTAKDHPKELVIGSTGTDAVFEDPYLANSLVVWTKDGIEDILSDEKKELSCAYRYRADMTPGVFEGVSYDGVMREIRGNHVALVREGRAGADVVVGDSMENLHMATKQLLTRKASVAVGALMAHLAPKLAQDARLDLINPFRGVTSKNFKSKIPGIVASIKSQTRGKLAEDASLGDVEKVLDMLDAHEIDEVGTKDAMETDPNSGEPMPMVDPAKKAIDAENADLRGFLKSKGMGEDDISTACGMAGKKPGMDAEETDEDKKKREDEEKKKKAAAGQDAEAPEKKPEVTKAAMDAAINTAVASVRKTERDIRDAENVVRPYVGTLNLAFDSAEGVFRKALDLLGVKHDGVHESALKTILELQPKPSAARKPSTAMAQDSASKTSFAAMFPEAKHIAIR